MALFRQRSVADEEGFAGGVYDLGREGLEPLTVWTRSIWVRSRSMSRKSTPAESPSRNWRGARWTPRRFASTKDSETVSSFLHPDLTF